MSTVHVVVPADVDDPHRPSGGNVYDRRICDGLKALGWSVQEHRLDGAWPQPDSSARASLASTIAALPDGCLVLVDGLIASTAADILVPAADRLLVAVLLHMPVVVALPAARHTERAVLHAAAAVITTSEWTRGWLLEHYAVPPERVHACRPGVYRASPPSGSSLSGSQPSGSPPSASQPAVGGGNLLCVAALTPNKGHDVLLDALAMTADLAWHCTLVGSLTRDEAYVRRLRERAREHGIEQRVSFAGARVGPDLQRTYAAADLVVLASRGETYGMVLAEAVAHGVPVLATEVGGVPEAIGGTSAGDRPGLLVPADDAPAFAAALRRWLTDEALRQHLRDVALTVSETVPDWSETTARVAEVLTAVLNRPSAASVSG